MSIDLDLLMKAYGSGIFPMADARDDPEIFWVEPKNRAVLPLNDFHMSRSLRKKLRSDQFKVTTDTAFADVIAVCAQSAEDRHETWINGQIETAFIALHKQGRAHSVECWQTDNHGEEQLVGGLYGLEIGAAFCGESMFSRVTDASKVALAWLVARLKIGGFQLLDCQFMTDHLASLGAIEISQEAYLEQLDAARSYSISSFSAMSSPMRSAGSDGAVGAWGGDGETLTELPSVPVSAGVSFVELDERLTALEEERRGAVGFTESSGGLSSPGKLIAQLLTQTS